MTARESPAGGQSAGQKLSLGGEGHGHDTGPPGATQTTLDEALDRALAYRDERAENALLSAHTYWRIAAENVVAELAAGGQVFSIEDVYARVGQPPGHLNAAGGLLLRAAKGLRVNNLLVWWVEGVRC